MMNPFSTKAIGSFADVKSAFGAGAHNTMIQSAAASLGTHAAWGAGVGATYGGIEGAISYDGSFLGGAVHGAMVGGVGGAAFKGLTGLYTKGAGATAGQAYKQGETFAWKNISNGWSMPSST